MLNSVDSNCCPVAPLSHLVEKVGRVISKFDCTLTAGVHRLTSLWMSLYKSPFESNAFWKSTKQANILPLFWITCLWIRVCRVKMWSDIWLFGRNPIWLLLKALRSFRWSVILVFSKLQNTFPRLLLTQMPLCCFGQIYLIWGWEVLRSRSQGSGLHLVWDKQLYGQFEVQTWFESTDSSVSFSWFCICLFYFALTSWGVQCTWCEYLGCLVANDFGLTRDVFSSLSLESVQWSVYTLLFLVVDKFDIWELHTYIV